MLVEAVTCTVYSDAAVTNTVYSSEICDNHRLFTLNDATQPR
jgi:hypothetical protein